MKPGIRRAQAARAEQLLEAAGSRYAPADARLIERAYGRAAQLHAGQRRRSGDPFISHPVAVAALAVQLHMHPAFVCAALLHDVLDGNACSPRDLHAEFGAEVADLVVAFGRLDHESRVGLMEYAEAADTYRTDVLALKILDRLHNMRTIRYLPLHRQYAKSRETQQLLAPLAQALGMTAISQELEHLAQAVLHPEPAEAKFSARLVTAATGLLPATARPRWRQEWAAELSTLPTWRIRARFAIQILRGVPRLAVTLRRPIRP
jgi:(p)ppGpp synthase/HD superfamily hydrolase